PERRQRSAPGQRNRSAGGFGGRSGRLYFAGRRSHPPLTSRDVGGRRRRRGSRHETDNGNFGRTEQAQPYGAGPDAASDEHRRRADVHQTAGKPSPDAA